LNIEISVLQAINYCFYEVLDNVLTHSGKQMGIVVTYNNIAEHKLSFLVADDGIGIQKSLSENAKYQNISEEEALQACIKESVTDEKVWDSDFIQLHFLSTMREGVSKFIRDSIACFCKTSE